MARLLVASSGFGWHWTMPHATMELSGSSLDHIKVGLIQGLKARLLETVSYAYNFLVLHDRLFFDLSVLFAILCSFLLFIGSF